MLIFETLQDARNFRKICFFCKQKFSLESLELSEDWTSVSKSCKLHNICNNYTYVIEFKTPICGEPYRIFVHESIDLTELYEVDIYHFLDKTEISIKNPSSSNKKIIEIDKAIDTSNLTSSQLMDKIHTYVVMW